MKGKLKTTEDFKKELYEVNDKVLIIGEYTKYNESILCKCPVCGNEWMGRPLNLLKGSGCPACARRAPKNRKNKTLSDILKESKKLYGDIYDFSESNYKNNKTPIEIYCKKHNLYFNLIVLHHLRGHCGCPKCSEEKNNYKLNKGTEDFINEARKIHGNKYDYSKVEYINAKTPVKIICPIHGEFEQIPSSHLLGKGCLYCANNIKYTTEQFIEKAKLIHGNKYDYSKVEYNGNKIPVTIICLEHGEFKQTPNDHLDNHGCPKCSASLGERIIEKFLLENNVLHTSLYEIFIDTSINSTGKAYVDFYLPDYNLFIEYNGKQHYVPVEYFGGKLKYNKLVQRDEFLKNYCKENNIKLLEIPYNKTQKEIIELLNTTLL